MPETKVKHKKAAAPTDWATTVQESQLDIAALTSLGLKIQPKNCVLYTINPHNTLSLRGMFKGKHAFLVCGGPSLKELDLTQLNRRGIVTMGVNNSWIAHKPNLWCAVDPAMKFIDTGWKDASIMKFFPIERNVDKLHIRQEDGTFKISTFAVNQMPNVWYYRRRDIFDHRTFLEWPSLTWGCDKKYIDSTGWGGCRSVMLPALRLLYYLGFKNVYIIGADFSMKEQLPNKPAIDNYAWDQFRQPSSVGSNNRTYASLNDRFAALDPVFKAASYHVWNCTPGGNMNGFDRMEYSKALDRASKECEKEVGTLGWYNHKFDKEGKTVFITK